MQQYIKHSITTKNRIQILQLLQEDGAISRIDIAKKMNITKAAVTLITNEMIRDGILYERGIQPQSQLSRGRRKILLDINENYKLALGIVFDNDSLLIGLTNLRGETLDKHQISILGKTYHNVLECVVSEISRILQNNCLSNDKILALGVCISADSGAFIEGSLIQDKLHRVKKDLSHAIDLPICTQSAINASLIAQNLFSSQKPPSENILMLRYGSQIESGVFLQKKIYMPSPKYLGGFTELQKMKNSKTYLAYLDELVSHENPAELTLALNSQLANDIYMCNTILSVNQIYVFGEHFETPEHINKITEILSTTYKQKTKLSVGVVTDKTLYLAACAIAIQIYFFQTGGC